MRLSHLSILTLAGGLYAAPIPCGELGTFQDLLNAAECSLGEFTVKNPSFSASEGGVGADSIPLNAGQDENNNLFFNIGSGLFGIPGETLIYRFGYLIDPPPEILEEFSAEAFISDFSSDFASFALFVLPAQAPSDSMLTFDLCAGAAFTDTPPSPATCLGQYNQLVLTGLGFLSGGVDFKKTNILDILMEIRLEDGANLAGALSTRVHLTPEPSTLVLGLAGLGLLAWFRRR